MKILLPLLLISSAALADDAAILRCRSIADPTARLACYDALVVTSGGSAATKAEAARSTIQQAAPTQPLAQQKMPLPSQAQASPPIPQSGADQFGNEEKILNRSAVDAIESTIPGKFEGWSARTQFKLANGQVWQVADDSSRDHYITNPKVRIRRGALGAFYLEIQGTNFSPRVKRVQ